MFHLWHSFKYHDISFVHIWGTWGYAFFPLEASVHMYLEPYFCRALSNFYNYHQIAKLFTYDMKMKEEAGTEIVVTSDVFSFDLTFNLNVPLEGRSIIWKNSNYMILK